MSSTEIATQTSSVQPLCGPAGTNASDAMNFDILTNLVTSPVALANELVRPKILKMIDTIQSHLELNNEKLIVQTAKNREHQLIELAKKSSDLNHRQQLQTLLIESLGLNDFRKASYVFSFLSENHHSPDLAAIQTSILDNYNNNTAAAATNNYNTTDEMDDNETFTMNGFESSPVKSESYNHNHNHNNTNNNNNTSNSLIIDYDDDPDTSQQQPQLNTFSNSSTSSSSRSSNLNINRPFTHSSGSTSAAEYNNINLNDSIRDAFTKAKKTNPLSPIRHLICSPGLEAKAQNCKIIILFKGRCNGICYQNKPWSKEMHIHYIINTVNCNDHVSRLVKKQGIQFYNSFVLQNQERIKQLIQMYKMEKV